MSEPENLFSEEIKLREDVLAGLVAYGYAPGGYMGTCHACGSEMWNVAKRSFTCVHCAMKAALDAAEATRTQKNVTEPDTEISAQVLAAKAQVFAASYESARQCVGHREALSNAVEALQRFLEVASGKNEPPRS